MEDKDPIFDSMTSADDSIENTLYTQAEGAKNSLERLIAKIPGLAGYIAKNDRREADQTLRNAVAARIEAARLDFSRVYEQMSADIVLAIDYAERLGRINTALAGLSTKIKSAPVGYASYFNAVKVEQAELEKLYAFDEQFFDHADNISIHVAALNKAVKTSGDVDEAVGALSTVVHKTAEAFAARDALLIGIA